MARAYVVGSCVVSVVPFVIVPAVPTGTVTKLAARKRFRDWAPGGFVVAAGETAPRTSLVAHSAAARPARMR